MILQDVQELTPGNMVTLFEVDHTALGGSIDRFHNHNDGEIVWQGDSYYPWSINASNFERTGEGQQPNPSMVLSNIGIDENGNPITGVITALCLQMDDLVGARVTRKRTFAKYLDAVNFEHGNANADPNEHLPDEVWIVSQKESETPEAVSFVLTTPMQFDGVQLPRRQILAGTCGWLVMDAPYGGYRGSYCGYSGTNYFDKDGNPVVDPSMDKCGGRVSDCKKRFGDAQPLSFGSFPTADRVG